MKSVRRPCGLCCWPFAHDPKTVRVAPIDGYPLPICEPCGNLVERYRAQRGEPPMWPDRVPAREEDHAHARA